MSIFHRSHPEDADAVSGAPNLPEGFTDTFTSRYIDTGEVRLHAVIGGDGPPLLLVHGWPETWYAWRMLMPTLAREFEVIAVDQRGMWLSDNGYDTGTQARDLIALMEPSGTGASPWSATTPASRSPTRSAPTTPSASSAWPSSRSLGRRERSPRRPCSSPGRSTTGSGTSASTGSRR